MAGRAGGVVTVANPRARFTLAGLLLWERGVEALPDRDVEVLGEGRWRATGARPSVRLHGWWTLGRWTFVPGVALVFVALMGAALARVGLWRGLRWAVRSRACAVAAACLLVVGAHGAVAAWSPVVVTADGMDYIAAADDLAQRGGMWSFPDYKAPGLSVVVAAAMLMGENFLRSYAWMAAGLGVAMSVMTFALVRRRCGFWWAYGAALLVGLHPTLLVYQGYLLRELPSAAVLTGVALLLVRLRDGRGRGAWVSTVLLAIACAAGAYLRENLQLLVPLVPVLVLLPGAGGWKGRAVRGAVVGVVAMGLLWPRIAVIHERYGNFSVVCPKVEGNRLLSAWANRVGDANDTALATREQWQKFRGDHLAQPKSDYEFTDLVLRQSLAAQRAGVGPGGPASAAISEGLARAYMDETVARSPLKAARAAACAFISQIGLWNFQTGPMADVAAANEWYSRLLRGEAVPFASNYGPDTVPAMYNARLGGIAERLKTLVAASRRSVKPLEDAPATRLFNEWFYAVRLLRPVVAGLFLAGLVVAVRRRDWTVAGVGSIALLSMVGAALVVGTPTDRFSVPFIPLMVCLGVYALASVRGRGRENAEKSGGGTGDIQPGTVGG